MEGLQNLSAMMPLLIPAAIFELVLDLIAIIHLIRHPKPKNLNVWAWGAIILFISTIGPILYLLIGRGEEERR